MRKILGAIGAAVLAGSLALPAAGAAGKATVNVLHGIPGVTVNVCVDGGSVADGFRYKQRIVGATLPAGDHEVVLVAAGASCDDPAILGKVVKLEAGENYTIVAALDEDGTPRLRRFRNPVGPTPDGMARLTVRHTAQAPAVNVWANGDVLIGGNEFTWGKRATLPVPAGTYTVKVTLPGERKAVIGPADLTLRAHHAYQVFAIGKPGKYALAVFSTRVG